MDSGSAPSIVKEVVDQPDSAANGSSVDSQPAGSTALVTDDNGALESNGTSNRGVSLPLLNLPLVPDEPAPFWLRRSDQLFIGTAAIIGLSLLFVHWIRLSRWGAEPVEIDRLPERHAEYRIEINQASIFEWEELEGIGPALASRIVNDREQNGPFHSIEDLRRVRGIGPTILEKLAPHLEVSAESSSDRRSIPAQSVGSESR